MKELMVQFFGILAVVALCSVYQQKTRKRMIISKLCADIFWLLHYLLLGGYGAAIVNFIGIFRELVFMKREEKAWANKIVWPVLFILCGWISGIVLLKNPINLLLTLASSFVTISLWVKNPKLTKIITLPICSFFIIYNIYVGSYIGVMNESLTVFSIAISFAKEHFGNQIQSVYGKIYTVLNHYGILAYGRTISNSSLVRHFHSLHFQKKVAKITR